MAMYMAHEQVGYFCKDIMVVVDSKLKSMPYAQCGVRGSYESGYIEFYSYSSLIFKCVRDKEYNWTITWGYDAMPNCSVTTRKQVGRFLSEYFNSSYSEWKYEWQSGKDKMRIVF